MKKYKLNKIKPNLINGKFEAIKLDSCPTSLMVLTNGNLVCSINESLILLNENLQKIKSASTGGYSLCALNRRNEIYASVYIKNCIILYDLNLNELKQFGTHGSGQNQLYYPFGLCCHNDYLYICDYSNKRIQIFSLDFEYVNTIQTERNNFPRRIEISQTTICVSCIEETLFYDLKTLAVKYKCNYGTYNINYIDSIFYASNYQQNKFYFFDSDGNFIEEIPINVNLSENMRSWESGSLCKYKENLLITDFNSSKLLRFRLE